MAGGIVTFEAKDILWFADDKNAVCPKVNNGELLYDLDEFGETATLTPTGIGDAEYDTSGRMVIGSEVMSFNRSGDVLTITGRALGGTELSDHSSGASVQQTFYVSNRRIDFVCRDLLRDYAEVPSAVIPFSDWNEEAIRWGSNLLLTCEVTKPTGVNKLLTEISQLGSTIYWNSQKQEVGFKINRPPDEDTIYEVTDDTNIREISIDDRDDERLTDIYFYTDIKSSTSSADDGDSYRRARGVVDVDARSENEFNDSKIRQVYMRWLGTGNDTLISIIGKRLLNRFRWSPSFYTFRITYDPDMELTDVIRVNSQINQDVTGLNEEKLMQIVSIRYDKPKHEMVVVAQTYQFDKTYGLIAPNSTPYYTSASDEEKGKYLFFCDPVTGLMSDGSEPNVFA